MFLGVLGVTAPLLSKEELRMVKEAVIFPVMLDVIQSDMEKVSGVGIRLDLLIIASLKQVQVQLFKDHHTLKVELRQRGIKIITDRRTALGIEAEYLCRGYQHQLSLLWGVVRTEILQKASDSLNISLTDEG
jgi:hypothetical protein